MEVLFIGEIIKIQVATSSLYNISLEQHQTKYSRHHLDIDFCFHVAYFDAIYFMLKYFFMFLNTKVIRTIKAINKCFNPSAVH